MEGHIAYTQLWPVSLKTTWTTLHRRSWRFVSFNVLRHCLKYTVTVVFTCIQFFLLWQWLFHAKVAKHVVLPQRGVNFQFFFDLTQLIRFRMFFLHGVGPGSSSSFARNFLGVVVPRLCLPHHLYIYIYRNTVCTQERWGASCFALCVCT